MPLPARPLHLESACEPLCHLAKNLVHFILGEGSQGLHADIACCTNGQDPKMLAGIKPIKLMEYTAT